MVGTLFKSILRFGHDLIWIFGGTSYIWTFRDPEVGLLAARVGKDVMPLASKVPGIEMEKCLGVSFGEFDHFHELVAHEESSR